MKFKAIQTVVRYVGCGCAIILAVALFSFIFSFLGTILCAVLGGMMMGAAKKGRWVSIPLSLVFPGVIFTLLRATKADLAGHQINQLALLCFGTFWLTHFLTWAVVRFERKQQTPSPAQLQLAPAPSSSEEPSLTQAASALRGVPTSLPEADFTCPPGGLSLEVLQGEWACATVGLNGHSQKKVMAIQEKQFVLSVTGAQGRSRLLAKGEVKLETSGPLSAVVLSATEGGAPGDSLVAI